MTTSDNRDYAGTVLLIAVGTASPLAISSTTHKLPPIGLLSIGAVLEAHCYQPKIFNLLAHPESLHDFTSELRTLTDTPLMVGFTVFTETVKSTFGAASAVRAAFPDTTIVFGGPHSTFCPEELLSHSDVDYVIRGEGEPAVVELLEHLRHRGLPLSEIRGLVYRDPDGRLIYNESRPFQSDLDELPIPSYHLTKRPALLMIIASRGCPGQCTFCASGAVSGAAYRMHSAEFLFSVVHEYLPEGDRGFAVMDDTFTVNKKRTLRFCRLLHASGRNYGVWSIKSRADHVSEDVVRELAAAGCSSVHIGVESGDDEVLKKIGKNITVAKVRRAVEVCLRHHVNIEASFMIGHHCDTLETIEKTMILALALQKICIVAISISTAYPGTYLYNHAAELNVRLFNHDWVSYNLMTPTYDTPNFTANDLLRAMYLFNMEGAHLAKRSMLSGNTHEELWDEMLSWVTTLHREKILIRELETKSWLQSTIPTL